MIPRMTTIGVLNNYRYDLNKSNNTMSRAMNMVMTGRSFASYAEDPALATRCFQIRRSYQRASSQLEVNTALLSKYNQAWSALDTVSQDIYDCTSGNGSTAFGSVLRAQNGADASGRNALGQSLEGLAKNLVQTMNGRNGENYIFGGAETLDAPFTWEPKLNPEYDENYGGDGIAAYKYLKSDGTGTNVISEAEQEVYFRGVRVDCEEGSEDAKKLEYFLNETKNMDVGLGHKEVGGTALASTVFNSALQGIYYLGGYGTSTETVTLGSGETKEVEVPNNLISIISELGTILQRCNEEDGSYASAEDAERAQALAQKLESQQKVFMQRYAELDTGSSFLRDNGELLTDTASSLAEQFLGLEDVDPAEAITAYMYARYCYDAALKLGNSVLPQSLMDYMS